MRIFNSFQELLAANADYGRKAVTDNAYSEEEKQRQTKLCESAIQEAEQELKEIQTAFLKAHNQYRLQRYVAEHGKDNEYRKLEIDDRIEALKARIIQIQDIAPNQQFLIQCFDIETKLNKFKAQLAADFSDKPELPQKSLNHQQVQD